MINGVWPAPSCLRIWAPVRPSVRIRWRLVASDHRRFSARQRSAQRRPPLGWPAGPSRGAPEFNGHLVVPVVRLHAGRLGERADPVPAAHGSRAETAVPHPTGKIHERLKTNRGLLNRGTRYRDPTPGPGVPRSGRSPCETSGPCPGDQAPHPSPSTGTPAASSSAVREASAREFLR